MLKAERGHGNLPFSRQVKQFKQLYRSVFPFKLFHTQYCSSLHLGGQATMLFNRNTDKTGGVNQSSGIFRTSAFQKFSTSS